MTKKNKTASLASIRMEPEDLDRIDAVAKTLRIQRAGFVRMAVMAAVEKHEQERGQ